MTAVVFAVPKWVATAAKALFGKATGNVIVVCLEKYIHCLIANNDKTKQRTAIRICRIIFEIACY